MSKLLYKLRGSPTRCGKCGDRLERRYREVDHNRHTGIANKVMKTWVCGRFSGGGPYGGSNGHDIYHWKE